jgi:hypothetical protein
MDGMEVANLDGLVAAMCSGRAVRRPSTDRAGEWCSTKSFRRCSCRGSRRFPADRIVGKCSLLRVQSVSAVLRPVCLAIGNGVAFAVRRKQTLPSASISREKSTATSRRRRAALLRYGNRGRVWPDASSPFDLVLRQVRAHCSFALTQVRAHSSLTVVASATSFL